MPSGGRPSDRVGAAAPEAAEAVYNFALQAASLDNLKPNWLQATVLAIAFTDSWDLETADLYWRMSDGHIGDRSPQARIRIHTARARFHCVRGDRGDEAAYREHMNAALAVAAQGQTTLTTLASDRTIMIRLMFAGLEADSGHDAEAATHLAEAWLRAATITSPFRRTRAELTVARMVVGSGFHLPGRQPGIPPMTPPPAAPGSILEQARNHLLGTDSYAADALVALVHSLPRPPHVTP